MASLYVANLTRQYQDFHYRLPTPDASSLTNRVQVQRIPPGEQQMVFSDAPLKMLEAIVEQHVPFGIKPADEITNTRDFVGLAFSYDKPVNLDRMQYAADHNVGVLTEAGEERRVDRAVAIADALTQNAIEAQRAGMNLPTPRAVALESAEDSDNPKFSEGIRVDQGPTPSPGSKVRERRRPRR